MEKPVSPEKCPFCGEKLESDAKFCPSCGSDLTAKPEEQIKFCPNCGKKQPIEAKFCSEYGWQI